MTVIVLIINMVRRTRILLSQSSSTFDARTIDITDITAAKHVAVTICKALLGANLTTMDMYLRLSEDIAVSIEAMNTTVTQDVVALTATEDVTLHMAVKHFNMCLTRLVDGFQFTVLVVLTALLGLTTSDGGNLTATEDAVTDQTAPYHNVGRVDATVVIIATAKEVTAV